MRIACVQMDINLGDPAGNLARMDELAQQAASAGAELVIFPECSTAGYCFASRDEALPFAEELSDANSPVQETIDGRFDSVGRMQAVCAANKIHAVYGTLEMAGDKLYNVAVCVGPAGLVAKYRKTHLPKLGVDHFTAPGDNAYSVIEVGGLRLGMLICYDASFPEATRVLMLKGADLVVLPTNWPPGAEQTADFVINARASENKIYFAAASRVGTERGFDFIGKSKICDVLGNSVEFADHRREAVIVADIDLELARNKRIERVPGKHSIDRRRDRRPDLYGALVTADPSSDLDNRAS